jgi:hypothetical protein
MSLFGFLWDLNQEKKILKAKDSSITTSQKTNHVATDVHFLRAMVERQAITNAALIELLTQHLGISENDIINKIEEIDLRDGVKDGKITSSPKSCKSCQRVLPAQRNVCLYCGEPN